MSMRFRKSLKILPGVKVNLGKKSVGLSLGNKYGGVTVNSGSGVHTRTSLPGTGISFIDKIGGRGGAAAKEADTMKAKKPIYKRWWVIALAALLVIGAVQSLGNRNTEPMAARRPLRRQLPPL